MCDAKGVTSKSSQLRSMKQTTFDKEVGGSVGKRGALEHVIEKQDVPSLEDTGLIHIPAACVVSAKELKICKISVISFPWHDPQEYPCMRLIFAHDVSRVDTWRLGVSIARGRARQLHPQVETSPAHDHESRSQFEL